MKGSPMTDKTVTQEQPAGEPSVWADVAAELRRIADDVLLLVGEDAPLHVELTVQPARATIQSVDDVAAVLVDKHGEAFGTLHRAYAHRGPVALSIYRSVPEERDAELAKLRARVAELEGYIPRASGAGTADAIGTYRRCAVSSDANTACTLHVDHADRHVDAQGWSWGPELLNQPVERPL